MRTIKLVIAYDGTDFHGWQVQPGTRTVQGEIESILSLMTGTPTRLYGAGRTDAGVHALGQVGHFRTESAIGREDFFRGLNGLLSDDIGILSVEDVSGNFDARRSATARVYRYFISEGGAPLPFTRRYVWHMREMLDLERMTRAASHLIGTHDFASFAGAGGDDEVTIRDVYALVLSRNRGGIIEICVEANAFLRHMVRNIAGTLVEVGRGRRDPDEMPDLILAKDRAAAGETAPARGLFLVEVKYP
ncbi:MAG: tRNA pseudouridine(38-40) synthase TruA [Deltaproteobacteria bacterium]|nr:tRNA pseudouridine(38-40) synthase TruA [Candidatus Zymogenaceae bacterium]